MLKDQAGTLQQVCRLEPLLTPVVRGIDEMINYIRISDPLGLMDGCVSAVPFLTGGSMRHLAESS